MDCDKCGDEAIMHAAYSGLHLCDDHFCRSVETRVRRRVRKDTLVPRSATPDDPETWVVGLSGGKDSVVLTQVLHDTFEDDPRIELVALTIHEGIEGYRDESLEACEELTSSIRTPNSSASGWTTWSRTTPRGWPPAPTAASSAATCSNATQRSWARISS